MKTVSRWLAGRSEPRHEHHARLVEVFPELADADAISALTERVRVLEVRIAALNTQGEPLDER